jgi:hypothetical protein
MTISHLKITQAGLVALLVTIIGQLVAFVPALAPDKQILISAASTAVAAAFLIANAIHALIATKVSSKDLETDLHTFVSTEVGKLDVNAIVDDAVTAKLDAKNIPSIVHAEFLKLLSNLDRVQTASAPVVNTGAVSDDTGDAPAGA